MLVERNQFEWIGPLMLVRTTGNEDDVIDAVVRANSTSTRSSSTRPAATSGSRKTRR